MMNFLFPAMVMEIVGALGRGLNRGGGVGGSCLFDFSLIIYPLNYISQLQCNLSFGRDTCLGKGRFGSRNLGLTSI